MTAAHCVQPPITESYVYLGIQDTSKIDLGDISPGVEIKVSRIIIHPSYNPTQYTNDIAILKLSESVVLNKYIQPACLPTNLSYTYPPVNSAGYIVGWGINILYLACTFLNLELF